MKMVTKSQLYRPPIKIETAQTNCKTLDTNKPHDLSIQEILINKRFDWSALCMHVKHAVFIVYILDVSATLVGLVLLYTKQLFGMFQFCIRQTAEVENQVN